MRRTATTALILLWVIGLTPMGPGHQARAAASICAPSVGPGIPPPPTVPAGVPGYHAAWFGQSGYPSVCPGETASAVVAYYNSGSRGWVAGRPGETSYLGTWNPVPGQDRASALGGDGTNGSPSTGWPVYNRVAVQPAAYVAPGQVAWFTFTVKAPVEPGTYLLAVRPLVEGTEWMEDYGVFWYVTVQGAAGARPNPMPLLSTRLPASAVYTNDESLGAASNVRDGSFASGWRTANLPASPSAPNYIAYDLTSIPASSRRTVYSLWLNENYDFDTAGAVSYGGLIGGYKIQANAAPGGSLPTSGWIDLTAVNGNTYTSRANLLALVGYNWVRILVSADSPTAEPTFHRGSGLQEWQLFDAGGGADDSWIFLGDSITSNALTHDDATGFDVLIHAAAPDRLPAWQKGSHGGWSTGSYLEPATPGPTVLDNYLAAFPGRYVAVALGTNDLSSDLTGSGAGTFFANMRTIVDKILASGKVPIVPRIIYSPSGSYGPPNSNYYKATIDQLWSLYADRVVHGPDLYTPFFADAAVNGGPNLYWTNTDGLHPNSLGERKIRQLWADAMLVTVYGAASRLAQ